MSPISLGLNLLLATLLLLTLRLGWRLNRQLKALKDGHAGFAAAIAELDRSAARAEKGLSDLRAATEESVEFLAGRIEKGRELAARLERLIAQAAATAEPAAVSPRSIQASPQVPRASSGKPPPERAWADWRSRPGPRPANERAADPPADPEAAAESLILRLSEVLDAAPPPAPRAFSRPQAAFDDDLFEAPSRPGPRAVAGGR